MSKWDAEYINVDQATLFDLVLAANYLDIKPLMDLGCKAIALQIKGFGNCALFVFCSLFSVLCCVFFNCLFVRFYLYHNTETLIVFQENHQMISEHISTSPMILRKLRKTKSVGKTVGVRKRLEYISYIASIFDFLPTFFFGFGFFFFGQIVSFVN